MRINVSSLAAPLCLFVLWGWGLRAATAAPAGFHVDPYLSGLGTVTALAFAPDGTLFIASKGGQLRVLPYGAGSPRSFATIPVYTTSECGLLGVALDPGYRAYSTGGLVYVFATLNSSTQRIIRFRDVNGTGSERFDLPNMFPTLGQNHDGGSLRIGPDGKFYLAVGDGGSGSSKSQDLTNLFGKVLRLNLDGGIPADNPSFAAINPSWRREIFAYGFRNPFRVILRPQGDGPTDFQVFVNDVGSSGSARREEVNLVVGGRNYGWPNAEGIAQNPAYVNPIHAYSSQEYGASGSSITGGVFYQGDLFPPQYKGDFFYMDYVFNHIFRMTMNGDAKGVNETFHIASGGLIDMAEGPDGALYVGTNSGQVLRIRYEPAGNQRPVAALDASPASGGSPLLVSFDAGGSTDPDGTVVRYDWAFGDGASLIQGGPRPSHTYTRDGRFTARVTVTDNQGGAASATAVVDVSTVNLPPAVEILAPADGVSHDAGATVDLAGGATDPEDGELTGTRLRWDVVLHHNDHTHPWLEDHRGATGSFNVPSAGIEEDWSFRVRLTATDSANHSVFAERTVRLNYLPLRLESDPVGARLTADGVSLTAPAVYQAVNGARVELGAPAPQALTGAAGTGPHLFDRWSDGGAATHEVTARADLALTAVFAPDRRAVFLRGDMGREGRVDVSDAIALLGALFTGGPRGTCDDASDANDDGKINIADAVAILFSLFLGDGPLPPPSSAPGFDPTPDALRCEEP